MHECLEKFKTTKLSRSHKWHTGLCLPRHNTRFQLLEIQVIVVFLLIALVSVFIIILEGAGIERGWGLNWVHSTILSLIFLCIHLVYITNSSFVSCFKSRTSASCTTFLFPTTKNNHYCWISLRRKIAAELIISPGSTLNKGLCGEMGPRAEGLPFSGFRCIEWKGFHKCRYMMWKGREICHVRLTWTWNDVKYNTWFSG